MRDLSSVSFKKRGDMKRVWDTLNRREGWVRYEKIESFLAAITYSEPWRLLPGSLEIAKQKHFISELMLAVECRWLQIDNVEMRFADKETYAFFAGVKLSGLGFDGALRTLKYGSGWRRIYPKNDLVAVSLVSVSKNPAEMINSFANTDFIVAAKCINSGFQVQNNCRRKVVRDLYAAMLSDQDSGRRPADCARELVQMEGSSAAPAIIQTIRTTPITTYIKTELSDYLANCGKEAVLMLLDALNKENENFCHYYFIRAIRDIGDSQAVEPLVRYLENHGQQLDHRIRMITVAALARLGHPQYVMLAQDMSFASLW